MVSETRPWGSFTILHDTPVMKVKELRVLPGQRLSYQMHEKRREHWFVVSGTATVTLDGAESVLYTGDSVDVPVQSKHRIANAHNDELVLIEVQTGSYFGEDDIVRFADDYNRA